LLSHFTLYFLFSLGVVIYLAFQLASLLTLLVQPLVL